MGVLEWTGFRLNIVSVLRILAVLAVIFAPRAEACSCMIHKGTEAEQVLEALNDSGVVFVARLRHTTLIPDKQYAMMTHEEALFVVIEVLRGPLFLGQPILVRQVVGAGFCGMPTTNNPPWMQTLVKPETEDEEGVTEPTKFSKDWLIYSDGPGPYDLSMCSRSSPLNIGGDDDLKLLREFVKHPPKWPLDPSTGDRKP